MSAPTSELLFRVRYSETDQMGGYYYSRVLEWFECGRVGLLRELGLPYSQMEARGVFLPVIEAHVEYFGRARFEDRLRLRTTAALCGKARLRCDCHIARADGSGDVARGYTVHAFTDGRGRPVRPPRWFLEALGAQPAG